MLVIIIAFCNTQGYVFLNRLYKNYTSVYFTVSSVVSIIPNLSGVYFIFVEHGMYKGNNEDRMIIPVCVTYFYS